MKSIKLNFIILVIFLKTGNVLSEQSIFNVNNIEVVKKANISHKELDNQAIKKGFNELINKILIDKDIVKISKISFSEIKQLVSYYQVFEDDKNQEEKKMMYEWNLTAKTILHTDEWKKVFQDINYSGDYYWFKP